MSLRKKVKLRIKSCNGDFPRYFEAGRVYEGERVRGTEHVYTLYRPEGTSSAVRTDSCAHLNGGCWEIVE